MDSRPTTTVSDEELDRRRRLGLDRRDEVWDGVTHMVPPSGTQHQELGSTLAAIVRELLMRDDPDVFVAPEVAVADPARWPHDFRVPDVVVCRGGEGVAARYVTRADLVVEILSPEDETLDKLPFYAARGVDEVLIVDRDAGRLDLRQLSESSYSTATPDADGWVASRCGLDLSWDAATPALRVCHRASGAERAARLRRL